MKIVTSHHFIDFELLEETLKDGDNAWVVFPFKDSEVWRSQISNSEAVSRNIPLIAMRTKISISSKPDLYNYFSTKELAEYYCNLRNMSTRQIERGLNSQEGTYLTIGTKAFRTTEDNKVIACQIGKKSNPWKYKYFVTRLAGNKFLGINTEVEVAETKNLLEYDKESLLKVNPVNFNSYGSENSSHKTFKGREDYLDGLSKIKFNNSLLIKDLSDLFYFLIIKRYSTSNCYSARARTADDLYLLAKYQYKLDITFEECYKILCKVIEHQKEFDPNFRISLSWCSTVLRIVTSPTFPTSKTQEDFRKFFTSLKINKNING